MAEAVSMIQKQVAGYVLGPDDPEVLECALAGLRRAIDRMNVRNWNWALAYDDIIFVADQTDYSLTSWFKAPRNFELWNTDSVSVARLDFKEWKTFLMEHADATAEGDPCVYSVANADTLGTVTLNSEPSTDWVAKYPGGRIWYYRKTPYPTGTAAETIQAPPEATAFLQAWAEGYVADRYAVQKARDAYQRAREMLHEMVVDDCHGRTADWEGMTYGP